MQYSSKIALAAVAFASAVGIVNAAPAIGFGNNTGIDNETFVIQPYLTCIQDSQCGFGSFCDTPAGRCTLGCRADSHCAHDHRCQDGGCVMMTTGMACRQNGDVCYLNPDCCSGRCRREQIIFGKKLCIPVKQG